MLKLAILGAVAVTVITATAAIGGCWFAEGCEQVDYRAYLVGAVLALLSITGFGVAVPERRHLTGQRASRVAGPGGVLVADPEQHDAARNVVGIALAIEMVAVIASTHQAWNPHGEAVLDLVAFSAYMAIITIASLTIWHARVDYRIGQGVARSRVPLGFASMFIVAGLAAGIDLIPTGLLALFAAILTEIAAIIHLLAMASAVQLVMTGLPPVWATMTSAASLFAPLPPISAPAQSGASRARSISS